MPEKIVSDQTQDKTLKPTKAVRADEPVTEFKAKLNKWGFIHVPKKALPSLPFETVESLTARVEKMLWLSRGHLNPLFSFLKDLAVASAF
ncbi:MAG: hypothetical protein ACFFCW_49695 [Candidatus Hodarchaeota archaeon]